MDHSELDLFHDIPMDIRKKVFEKYPDQFMHIMLLLRAYKSGAFKVENGKIIRTNPPPSPILNADKRMVKLREDMKQYDELQRKAAVCKCPKGTHEQKQDEKATAGELG